MGSIKILSKQYQSYLFPFLFLLSKYLFLLFVGQQLHLIFWLNTILTSIIIFFLFFINNNYTNIYNKIWNRFIISFIFCQIQLLGQVIQYFHCFSIIWNDTFHLVLYLSSSIILSFVYFYIINILLSWFDSTTLLESNYYINYRRFFVFFLLIRIFLFFLFYPCVFDYDGVVGLRTFLDPAEVICNHHPIFVQLLHGIAFYIGNSIGHVSVGFACLTVIWIFITSIILIFSLQTIDKAGINRKIIKNCARFYLLFPLFPFLSIYPTKDGFFAYFFLLYLSSLYLLLQTQNRDFEKGNFFLSHSISAIMICLTRHQGIFIILFELPFLLYYFKNKRKSILSSSFFVLCSLFFVNNSIFTYFQVEPGGRQEILGTLFQQTSLYLHKYPKEITNNEYSTINKILNTDSLIQKFKYNITDPIKRGYKYNPRNPDVSIPTSYRRIDRSNEYSDVKSYLLVWKSMFLKHPITYIEATAAVSSGFFVDTGRPLVELQPNWANNRHSAIGKYNFWHTTFCAEMYNKYIGKLSSIPILGIFFCIPIYFWIAIFAIYLLYIKRDKEGLIVFLPFCLSLLLLFICPVALGRYIFPIVISLPLIYVRILSYKNNE